MGNIWLNNNLGWGWGAGATGATWATGATGTTWATGATGATASPWTDNVGYLNIPQNSQSTNYTTVLSDSWKCIFHPSSDANARTFTIDSNANVPYDVWTVIMFKNNSANNLTIAITSDTLTLDGTGTTWSRTLAQYGKATAIKETSTTWSIGGVWLT